MIVFTATNTDTKIAYLRGLFEHLGLNPEDLVFTLRPDRQGSDTKSSTGTTTEPESADAKPSSRYAALTKYLDEFDQAESLKPAVDSTAELREQFVRDFGEFSQPEAGAILGGVPVGDYIATKSPDQATEQEVLAVITQVLATAALLGQVFLHEKIQDGTLGLWLRRLQDLA